MCTATNNFYFKAIIIFLHSICQRKKNSKWKAMINLCSTAIVNWPPLQCHFQTIRRSPIYFYSACTNLDFGNIRRRRMKIAYFFSTCKSDSFSIGSLFSKVAPRKVFTSLRQTQSVYESWLIMTFFSSMEIYLHTVFFYSRYFCSLSRRLFISSFPCSVRLNTHTNTRFKVYHNQIRKFVYANGIRKAILTTIVIANKI